jgi:hypothetical protein
VRWSRSALPAVVGDRGTVRMWWMPFSRQIYLVAAPAASCPSTACRQEPILHPGAVQCLY